MAHFNYKILCNHSNYIWFFQLGNCIISLVLEAIYSQNTTRNTFDAFCLRWRYLNKYISENEHQPTQYAYNETTIVTDVYKFNIDSITEQEFVKACRTIIAAEIDQWYRAELRAG